MLYLVRASVVEAKVADGGHLGVQHLLLSLQLLLHLTGLGEGLGHGLVVVQVGSGGQRGQQVCWDTQSTITHRSFKTVVKVRTECACQRFKIDFVLNREVNTLT